MSDNIDRADRTRLIHGYTDLRRHRSKGALMMVRGDGVRLFDRDGRNYIEMAAGMWCATFGFSEPALVDAAEAQLRMMPYYHTLAAKSVEPAAVLAAKLADIVPIDNAKVHFALSGSEANDFLIKFLWYYNNVKGRPAKKRVISRINGYHGATIAATSLTGVSRNHALFDAPLDRFSHVGDICHYREARAGEDEAAFAARLADELEQEILRLGPETVMAFVAEPITGAGGVGLPPADYYARIQSVLRKYDVLFIADEVITGFGRTGDMFGCETYAIRPDAMVLGKALTRAYQPLSAIVISDEIYQGLEGGSDRLGLFGHGTTYSGYPVGTAVALRAIALLEERQILDHVRTVGRVLRDRLEALRRFDVVGDIRSQGLLAAVEFAGPRVPGLAASVRAAAEARGVITRLASAGDALCFSPPLVITEAEIHEAMDRFEAGLADVLSIEEHA